MTDMTLAMRLLLDSQKWVSGLTRAQGGMKGFVQRTRSDLRSLRGEFSGLTGQLAGIGLGFSAITTVMNSARMDKGLTQIRQTAGATKAEIAQLRAEMFRMGRETGNNVDSLQAGFGQLVAGGLTFDQALPTLDAINKAMAVSTSDAITLAQALQSAQEHFQFDLRKQGMSLAVLDKMLVAGRAGVIEIDELAGVFGSAATEARAANLTFEETLALIEGMGTATSKDRVGTLLASTLRLFNSDAYRKAAQKATGVNFYDADGDKRNALQVLADLRAEYGKLGTDRMRDQFMARAFGKADLDTQRGLMNAFKDGKIDQILSIAARATSANGGVIREDMADAIDNAVDASGRLKTVMREAADGFAQPINKAITVAIDFLTKQQKDGGLGLSGGQIGALGVAGILTAVVAKRAGGRAIDSLLGRFSGTAAGVAEGKALEAAAGVTPVFVTNAAQIGGNISSAIASGGVGAAASGPGGLKKAAGFGLAATGGWLAGEQIYEHGLANTRAGDGIGLWLNRRLAPFSADSRQALQDEGTGTGKFREFVGQAIPLYGLIDALVSADRRQVMPMEGVIKVEVSDDRVRARPVSVNQPGVEIQANTGRMMLGGGGR